MWLSSNAVGLLQVRPPASSCAAGRQQADGGLARPLPRVARSTSAKVLYGRSGGQADGERGAADQHHVEQFRILVGEVRCEGGAQDVAVEASPSRSGRRAAPWPRPQRRSRRRRPACCRSPSASRCCRSPWRRGCAPPDRCVPPGGKGTTTRIGPLGHSACACTIVGAAIAAVAPARYRTGGEEPSSVPPGSVLSWRPA